MTNEASSAPSSSRLALLPDPTSAAADESRLPEAHLVPLTLLLAVFAALARSALGLEGWASFILFGAAIGLVVLLRPLVGLVILAIALSMGEALPQISVATSLFPVLGLAAFGAYATRRLLGFESQSPPLTSAHVAALAFVAWLLATNPTAAIRGPERNWLMTYAQLLLLLWLSSQVFTSPARHRLLMWWFSVGATMSAFVATTQGTFGLTLQESIRAGGLTGGVNTAARYYVVALVFLVMLYASANRPWQRGLALGCGLVNLAGLTFTISRSGLLLVAAAAGVLILDRIGTGRGRGLVGILLLIGLGLLMTPERYWNIALSTESSPESDSTLEVRYVLWEAGVAMWRDHPIQGVGVGEFANNLTDYATKPLSEDKLTSGPHSIYIGVLAETGIFGLALFMCVVFLAIRKAAQGARSSERTTKAMAKAWLFALIVLLVGGITKHDQYDKLLWLSMGACLSFSVPGRRGQTATPETDAVTALVRT